MKKRILSFLLAFSMVLSLIPAVGFAEDGNKLAVLAINKIDTETCTVTDEAVDSAKPGDVIALTIGVKAGSADIGVAGYQFQLNYDSSVIAPWSQSSNEDLDFYDTNFTIVNLKKSIQNWGSPTSGGEAGTVQLALTYAKSSYDYTKLNASIKANESLSLIQVAFQVKSDVESCGTKFEFDSAYETLLIYYANADSDKVSELTFERETTALTINGVTPTLSTVSLSGEALGENNTVTVAGGDTAAQTIQATAASLKGTDLTTSVAWSVSPADGGVSIGADTGVITVANNAKAGEYTITAAPKDDKVQGEAKSATLTVVRETAVATTITIFRRGNGDVAIPGVNAEAAEATFGFTVRDQYGDMFSASSTWKSDSKDPQIKISWGSDCGVLTVEAGAQPATVKVWLEYGNVQSNEVTVNVVKAPSEVASVEITNNVTEENVPLKGGQFTRDYKAEVKDQYGTVLTGKIITWSIEGTAPNGVTIDEDSGQVTIRPAAAKNTFDNNNELTFTVKATCEGKSAAKVVTLKREPSTVDGLTVSGGQDNIEIPADNSTNSSAAFTVAVTDQYGQPMDTPEKVTWTIKDSTRNDVNGVTIDNGVVKVTSAAAGSIKNTTGKELTVTAATSGDKFGTATITVKRAASKVSQLMFRDELTKDDTNYTVPTSGTNGKEFWAIIFKDQYGSEMNVPAEDVTWTFPTLEGVTFKGYTSGSYHHLSIMVQRAAAKNAFTNNALEFTVTATYKNTQISASMKCTLTRNAAVASSMVLDGDNSDTIVIPSTKKYTATVKDQYDLVMPGAQVTYSIEPANKGVTIDANTGLVTVSENAEKVTVYTVTAKCGGNLTDTRTFKAVDKTPHPGALTVAQNGFTYGETGKLNPTAKLGDKTVEAKFTYTIKDGAAVTTPTDAGTYTVTATYETETDIYTGTVDFTIAPATLTDSMFTLTGEYTYNGSAQTVAVETTLTSADYNVTGDQQATAGTHTVTFEGKGNYTGTVKKTWSIAKKQITAEIKNTITKSYDGTDAATVSPSDVTLNGVITGDNVIVEVESAKFASVNATSGLLIGVNVTVKLAGTDAGNYTLAETTITGNGRIDKAAHNDTTTSTSAKYGNTATLDLSALGLPEGYDFAQGRVQDENGILAGAEAAGYYVISGNTLRVPLKNDSAKAGKTATITLPVSSTNYASFDLVITVTVNDKLENSLAANDIYLTYGDTGYVTVTSIIGSLQTEIVSGEDVISLDNGTIKTLKAGTATLKLTASGNENYAEKSIQVKVTVSPKPITLTIDSKSAYVNDAQPALTYKVNGLVGADQLTTAPVLFVDVAEGVDPMKQVGTYAIKTSVTPDAGKNYSLTVEEGTLSVTNRPSAITPVGPSAGTVRVDETEGGTVRVTPANAAEGSTVTIVVTPDQGQELRSLEVLDKDGDSLELTDLGGGRFSFEMPRGKVTVKAEFGKAGLPYHDVKEGDWFYSAVEYVTEAGLMGDTGHGSFEPNTNTTRAMIWAILARLSGADTTPVSGPWYSVAQEWAMNSGVSDGTNPNGAITREQLVTMLYRYAETHGIDVTEGGMAIREFADVESVSSFAGPAMTWAVNTGLISGIDGKLVPQGLATRSQVATVLMRFAQLAK